MTASTDLVFLPAAVPPLPASMSGTPSETTKPSRLTLYASVQRPNLSLPWQTEAGELLEFMFIVVLLALSSLPWQIEAGELPEFLFIVVLLALSSLPWQTEAGELLEFLFIVVLLALLLPWLTEA